YPTAVEIPVDLQYQLMELPEKVVTPSANIRVCRERIKGAAEMLSNAQRPLIWAGGGVVAGEAHEELRELAERFEIPVVTSTQGRGSLPEDHEFCLGSMTA